MSRPRDEGTLFVVFVSPSPAASTQTGSANTFTLISFLDSSERSLAIYSSVLRRRRFVGPRDSDVCISSGRTTFDGARQSGHATETPLRRLMNRVRGQFGAKPHLEFPRALGHLSPRFRSSWLIFSDKRTSFTNCKLVRVWTSCGNSYYCIGIGIGVGIGIGIGRPSHNGFPVVCLRGGRKQTHPPIRTPKT